MRRTKGSEWNIVADDDGRYSWDQVHASVLMDIRDELKQLNGTLGCYRVQRMADAMIEMNRKSKPRRVTVKAAARVMAKRAARTKRRAKGAA